MVHGAEDGRVSHTLADPELDSDATVEEEHGSERQQKQSHHDEGRVDLPMLKRTPALLAAHVMEVVQKIILHLRNKHTHTRDMRYCKNNVL